MSDLTKNLKLRDPWMIAAWPGMGHVAMLAATAAVDSLQAELVGGLGESEFFAVDHVDVNGGVARAGSLPRSMFFVWRNQLNDRDLVFFVGESQPEHNGYAMCKRVVDFAVKTGVKRVLTIAAMATQLHPTDDPKVYGATTAPSLLKEFGDLDIEPLREGQISGLNGALLAAAAERGVDAVCLLSELPFFAVNLPNPRSAIAALDVFSTMSDIHINTGKLQQQAKTIEPQLLKLLAQLTSEGQNELPGADAFEGDATDIDAENANDQGEVSEPSESDRATDRYIESLFVDATKDRAFAFRLKQELDRLDVFDKYEDRFLDLFRNAG